MIAPVLMQLGAFVVVLGSGLFFHRHRDQLGRTPFASILGMTASVLMLADMFGLSTRLGVAALPLSTVSLMPAWFALAIVSWLGRGKKEISTFVLPQTSILLLWALGVVLFDQVAHAPWGDSLVSTPPLSGGPNRVGVIAFTAAGGLVSTLACYRGLRAAAPEQPLGLRSALACALGCGMSILLEASLSAGTVPVITSWLPAAGARLLMGLLAGAVVGRYLESESQRLGGTHLDRLVSNLDWAAHDYIRDPYVRLFSESSEALLVAEAASSQILLSNTRAQDLLRREDVELLGKSVTKLLGQLITPTGATERITLTRSSGETRNLAVDCTPIALEEQSVYLITLRDITHQLADVDRRVKSERMEVVSRIAGGIAHDFNNLLQGILGYTDFLKPTTDPELLAQGLETIQRYATRGAELTHAIQNLSRDQEQARGACDARSAVHNVAQMLRGGMGKGLTVQVRTIEEDAFVPLPPTRLEELLLELSINARDAMPNGGVLRLTVGTSHIDALDVEQGIDLPPGEYVEVSLKDGGVGMSPEMRRVALEPYTSDKEGHHGLGLAVVYNAVRSAEGWMTIDSIEGQGTVIRMLFPRVYTIQEDIQDEPSLMPTVDYPRRILVVDDESDLREMIDMILSARGFEVVQATGGGEALDVLETDAEFDTILLDMVMPGVDGAQVIRELHKRDCPIPIVMATGFAPEELDPECHRLVSGTLRKPFLAKELVAALEASWRPLPIF